jgi:hypothetical protein
MKLRFKADLKRSISAHWRAFHCAISMSAG